MKAIYLKLNERFEAFSLRERLMFTSAILLIMYMVFDMVAMSAVYQRRDEIVGGLKDVEERNKALDAKILEVSAQVKEFNVQGKPVELESLQESLQQSNKQLQNMVVKFVKPQEMVQVLREVLKDVKGLKLMRVKSVGVVSLLNSLEDKSVAEHEAKYKQALRLLRLHQKQVQIADREELQGRVAEYLERREKQDHGEDEMPQIYKHGILIELSGSYTATLQYLRMLENLQWKFYWEAMRFEIEDYPTAKISIVINTLSLNKDWVRV